jgi:hypothetical protein
MCLGWVSVWLFASACGATNPRARIEMPMRHENTAPYAAPKATGEAIATRPPRQAQSESCHARSLMRSELRRCYREGVRAYPGWNGEVRTHQEAESSTTIIEKADLPADVRACFKAVVAKQRIATANSEPCIIPVPIMIDGNR